MLAKIAALAPEVERSELVPRPDARNIEHDVRTLVGFGTRHTLSDPDDPERGIGAARRWIENEFRTISKEYHDGRLEVEALPFHVDPGRRVPSGVDLVDVVATLPGSEPERLIVISAHYDSRASNGMDARSDAPGADDDASGVAAVLEAARVLSGVQPRASLVFVAFAGEEQGLYGSRALARHWKEEGKRIVGVFNLDIVGGVLGSSGKYEPWRMRVFSEGLPTTGPKIMGSNEDAPSRELARYLERAGEETVPGFDLTLVFRPDRFLRGGDQKSFSDLGWPAVRLSEPHENYHWQHQNVRKEDGVQYGDLPEHLDYDFIGRVTHATAAAMRELALAPHAPGNVVMDVSSLTPDTTLIWDPSDDPRIAGYAVLYRRTHEPTWTHRRIVGTDNRVTLEGLSKDDWLFAVESFDQDNNRSVAVFPKPRF